MAKKPTNSGKTCTQADISQLKKEALSNTPTRVIGLHMKRTPEAISAKASELGVSLKPTNQSPYNRET